MDLAIIASDVASFVDACVEWMLRGTDAESHPSLWVHCVDVRVVPMRPCVDVCAACGAPFTAAAEDAYCCGPCLRADTLAQWFHPPCWQSLADPTCLTCGGYMTE